MKPEPAFTIRPFRASDRAAVRRLCCQTGFLGTPIDPVYEDRELFADFLTTYYTDHEPESSFVLEADGELKGYLLGSRKPLLNQLYSFQQNLVLFVRSLLRYSHYNEPSRRLLLRVGFQNEGLARAYLKINGVWRDHLLFGMLAGDLNPL